MNITERKKIKESLLRMNLDYEFVGEDSLNVFMVDELVLFKYSEIFRSPELSSVINWQAIEQGLIGKKISTEYRKILSQNKISYIDTSTGYIKIFSDDYSLSLRVYKKKSSSKFRIRPTLIFSAQSLKIIDYLFSSPHLDLMNIKQREFCEKFNLSTTRLSNLIREFGATSLLDLKVQISCISVYELIDMMDDRKIKIKLPSFYEESNVFYVDVDEAERLIDRAMDVGDEIILPGPVHFSELFGVRRMDMDSIELWCDRDHFKDIFRAHRLKPFRSDESDTTVRVSQFSDAQKLQILKGSRAVNRLRYIWDLTYGDERARNSREELLRDYMTLEEGELGV